MKRHEDKERAGSAAAREVDASTPRARPQPGVDVSDAWYVAEGRRGQQLLDQGQVGQATEVFEAILTRLGDAPSYGRAVILGRLGRCFYIGGRPDLAVRRLREGDRCHRQARAKRRRERPAGHAAFRARGCAPGRRPVRRREEGVRSGPEDCRGIEGPPGPGRGPGPARRTRVGGRKAGGGADAVSRRRCGCFSSSTSPTSRRPPGISSAGSTTNSGSGRKPNGTTARRHASAKTRGHLAAAAHTWNQLAVLAQEAGRPEDAEGWYRKALEVDRRIGNPRQLGHRLNEPRRSAAEPTGRLVDARQLAEEALAVSQTSRPGGGGHPGSTTASSPTSSTQRLERQRETANGEPRWKCRHATIASCSGTRRSFSPRSPGSARSPSYGMAVILGQLGRCFHMGRRPDLAVAYRS